MSLPSRPRPGRLQAKCSACASNRFEEEADRAAATSTTGMPIAICERLGQAESAGDAELPRGVEAVLSTGGQTLDRSTREWSEQRFGHDFGAVRLHTGAEAAVSAHAIGAQAYTVGEHVVLPGGAGADRSLLAHELAHVVQQRGGPAAASPRLQRKPGATRDLPVHAPFSGFVLATDELEMRGDRRQAFEHTGQVSANVCERPDPTNSGRCAELAPGSDVNVTRIVVPPVVYEDTGVWYEKGGAGWYEIDWPDQAGKKGYVLGVFIEVHQPAPKVEDKKPPPGVDVPDPVLPKNPPGPKRGEAPALETFCKPFATKATAMKAHEINRKILLAFTAKFGSDVQELWRTYMDTPKSGTTGVLPPRKLFADQASRVVKEFRDDEQTVAQRDILFDKIYARVKDDADFIPPEGGSTGFLPVSRVLRNEDRFNLPMRFGDPANKIPGNIAGGYGTNSSDAGDDVRNADGVFAVTNVGLGLIRLQMALVIDVLDAIDFCPGAPGSLIAQLGLTDDLSRLEATPDVPTYDTPFDVVIGGVTRDENLKL